MGAAPGSPLNSLVRRLLPRLRYPYLFLVLGGLLVVDLIVPDPVPLVDELILALLTFIAATFTTRRDETEEPIDVTPQREPSRLTDGKDRSTSRD